MYRAAAAQSKSSDTPFLFGAPAIAYTNYTNYNVPGGLLQMVKCIEESLVQNGGALHTRERVLSVEKKDACYELCTSKDIRYRAPVVVSNIPVWNMPEITSVKIADYFSKEASRYKYAWGAFTMGVDTDDVYSDDLTLHHQLHFNEGEVIPGIASGSVFVSFSGKNDFKRAPAGERVLNISTHTAPDFWFGLNGSLLDWTPSKTPFKGLYLRGDTVFPGQGIPGVTLSGINVYYRVKNNFKKLTIH